MTEDEYKIELSGLKEKHYQEVSKLNSRYAESIRIYEIGDIVQDRFRGFYGTVTNIATYSVLGKTPEPIYTCQRLKSDLTEPKNPSKFDTWNNRSVLIKKKVR